MNPETTPEQPNEALINPEQESSKEFKEYIDEGINYALAEIERKFEKNKDYLENMPFHNSKHTRAVMQRYNLLIEKIGEKISEKDKLLGRLAAAFHDIEQSYFKKEIQEGKWKKIIRQRKSGENEKNSAFAAIDFMQQINQKPDREIFSQNDQKIVQETIEITMADFDTSNHTVWQKNFNEKSSLVAKIVALSDLGAPGMEEPENFISESNALFREDNLDILLAVKEKLDLSSDQKKYLKNRLIFWDNNQIEYLKGRRDLLNKELNSYFPKSMAEKIKPMFANFNPAIDRLREKTKERGKMTFEQLIKDFGYEY